MNNLQIFKNEKFGAVRTLNINGEPYFVGMDVAKALGYINTRQALSTHVDKVDKTTVQIQDTGSNYKSNAVVINESGLYSLILSSKLPKAKEFKHWVTSEVLPSIRKTGGYGQLDIPQNIYVDNGREFLTFDVGGLGHRQKKSTKDKFAPPPVFERLGIKMTNAIVRNAKAKIIERRFKDVTIFARQTIIQGRNITSRFKTGNRLS